MSRNSTNTESRLDGCSSGQRWVIVLSGGEGSRLAPAIRRWLGYRKPKQYCAFTGTRSMLEHTLDRTVGLVPRQNRVVVIGRGHRPFLGAQLREKTGAIIEQPVALGTLPGILLPASYVWARDPEATLLILPSDHFVHPEDRLSKYLAEACWLAEHLPARLVLLGTTPRRPETEYGWIRPAQPYDSVETQGFRVSSVEEFHEKPNSSDAERFGRQGFLWNTMILAVKMRTLRNLVERLFPDWAHRFELLGRAYKGLTGLLACERKTEPEMAYRFARAVDFSGQVLEQIARHTVVLNMDDILWCDWGRPERIIESLSCIGKVPHFALGDGPPSRQEESEITPPPAWSSDAGAHSS